jgi:hypothetical protein
VIRKVFLILLALVLALSVGLVACGVPAEQEEEQQEEEEERPELMIYAVKPVEVEPEYILTAALSLFPAGVTVTGDETDEIYYLSSEPYYLECSKNSASIWYADLSKLYNEYYIPEELPSEQEARETADEFLESLIGDGVIPENVGYEFSDIGETQTAIFDLDTEETETWINHLDVLYGFGELDGIPVEGPGAKIRVSIGDGGEVIGLHYVWREVQSPQAYPAIAEEEATEILKERLDVEFETLEGELIYYAESECEKQDFLQPYYIFDGTVKIDGEEVPISTQSIPATTFSPIARIDQPAYDAEFNEGETIQFVASVSGGESPYVYTWESDIDGVIGTGASFSTDHLSVGKVCEEIVPHDITLEVTDKNGNQAVAITSLKIVPVESTSILAVAPAPEVIQTLSTNSPNDDYSDTEVGVYYINVISSGPEARWFAGKCARRFRRQLTDDGWLSKFTIKNTDVQETYFAYSGMDADPCCGVDTVDFAYYVSGWGYPDHLKFAIYYGGTFYFEDARWGGNSGDVSGAEGDLEWIVLDAPFCLSYFSDAGSVFSRWDQAFDGLHYVLGFASDTADSRNRGKYFVQDMKGTWMWSVRQAWIRATQKTQSGTGAYLRAGTSRWQEEYAQEGTLYDHLPGHGYVAPDPYPPYFLAYFSWSL